MKQIVSFKRAAMAAALAGFSAAASAQSAAVTALGTLQTEADSLISAAWPLAVAITVGLIGIKLFKKVAGRAS